MTGMEFENMTGMESENMTGMETENTTGMESENMTRMEFENTTGIKVIVKFHLVYKDGNNFSEFRKEIESSFKRIANDTINRINHNVSIDSKSHLHVEGNVFQLNPVFSDVIFTGCDVTQDSAELYFEFDQDAYLEKDLIRMIKMNLKNPNGKTYHKISEGIKAWQPDTVWMHMNSKRYVPKYLCDF